MTINNLKNYFIFITLLISYSVIFQRIQYTKKIFSVTLYTYKIPLEKYFVLDVSSVLFGLKRLVSDIAWIQLLQYYGGEPEEIDNSKKEEHICHENHVHNHLCEHQTKIQPGKYLKLIKFAQRITRLDHTFYNSYFYNIGSLAWNLNRPQEAIEYIKEGLQQLEYQKENSESEYWTLVLYETAIIYKMQDKDKEMIDNLKLIVNKGNAPNLVKSILANSYAKLKYYDEAISIWQDIYKTNDPEYISRSIHEIERLKKLKLYDKKN